MSAIAGRVLLIPKGNYDSTATYTMLDMVVYNGSSYICKQECTGVVPTNTTYWMLNASGSAVAYINDIGDVVITNPTNGQVLMYNSTTQKWVNGTLTLNGLNDTQFASLSDGQVLKYNATSQKWENGDISESLDGLTDTNISNPTNGQALVYNSTTQKWENATPVNSLSDLSDTTISSPSNGDILSYNNISGKWENDDSLTQTPITVGGETLNTIDDKLNYLCEHADFTEYTSSSQKLTGNVTISDNDYEQLIIISYNSDSNLYRFTHNGIQYSQAVSVLLGNTYLCVWFIPNVKKNDTITAPSASYVWMHLTK